MNFTIKSILLAGVLSVILTVIGGGNFYSFLFFLVLLFLPAILIFVSFDDKNIKPKKSMDEKE